MTIIIIAAIVAVLVLWFISTQRNLVSKDELFQNSMSQIGVQQQSRWDAITSLVQLTKSYNEHEYNTLRDVIAQRKEISGTSGAAEAAGQEELLTQAASRIRLVAEQYPELKASETYTKTMDSVNSYENQVRVSRMVYNDSVTTKNNNQWLNGFSEVADSLVAGMLHFSVKDYLKDPGEKAEMPQINI